MRLDQYLVDTGVFPSRARAQAAIKAGLVSVNGAPARKASQSISPEDAVEAAGDVHPYVSRGGLKLKAALSHFNAPPEGKVCLDLGASTGGFTDVLLRAGASKVYAVDVGRDQLHPSFRGDGRVVNLEKTHAADLSEVLVPEQIELLVCDVSFISLKKALPPALALCGPGAQLIALIKPQFEVGPKQIGKGGIVKPGDANSQGVADDIKAWLETEMGWTAQAPIDSPIEGGDGNREYLIGATRQK